MVIDKRRIALIVKEHEKTHSARAVAAKYGISPQTVLNHVAREQENRAKGLPVGHKPPRKHQARSMDFYRDEVESLVEEYKGKVSAKCVHSQLQCYPGFNLSLRTVQRAVTEAKKAYKQGHSRVLMS